MCEVEFRCFVWFYDVHTLRIKKTFIVVDVNAFIVNCPAGVEFDSLSVTPKFASVS